MSVPETPSRAAGLRPLLTALLMMLAGLAGCESVGYYAHVAGGQLKLLTERQPVERVLRELDDAPSAGPGGAALRARLELSQAVLAHAEDTIGLPVGDRYRSYVDLDREAVLWNLFAAPELSLEPHLWCYPVVGCLPYRGYFDDDRLRREQARLAARGLDTYVGPVLAYSTLGWFDDPLLSTFLALDDMAFVELLLHELSHSRVWVRGDATFNESFASFVGRQGARGFFNDRGRLEEFEAWERADLAWQTALRVLQQTRDVLRAIYAGAGDEAARRAAKRAALDAAGDCLTNLAVATGNDGYLRLIPRLNNAYLASLATYEDAVPVFAALFEAANGNWTSFFDRVNALAELGADERAAALAGTALQSGEHQVAADADDDGTDQVQCEALFRHGFDGEAAGAEHDDVGSGGDG